jgi:NAD(P)H dehydrogenase (quinone)
VNVVVVFYSIWGETERLALAAGVGAIQAHASIRLRRLPPGSEVQPGSMTHAQRESFERMSRDYTAPRPGDAEWADALIFATSRNGSSHLEAYLQELPTLASLGGRIAAPLAADVGRQVLGPIYAASAAAGLIVMPMPERPLESLEARQAFGRRVVALARAIKERVTDSAV